MIKHCCLNFNLPKKYAKNYLRVILFNTTHKIFKIIPIVRKDLFTFYSPSKVC